MQRHPYLFSVLAALSLPASAQISVDGTRAGDVYGSARAVQTVNTGFGDNASELNAAYARIENGRLYLMLTGNLENNFNNLEIFIDSVPGGENVFSGVPGNNWSSAMAGMTFDAGFAADVHLNARRGVSGTPKFHLDIARLGTPHFSEHLDVFGGANEGVGVTGTGPGNLYPIEVAYDGSNVGGVVAGTGAANPLAALAVTTGLELSIDLSDLGNPTGDVRVLAFVNAQYHNFASNQFLGGLPAPQINMGADGLGTFTGSISFDLNDWAGNQYFTVPNPAVGPGTNYCSSSPNSTGSAAILTATGSASLAANDLHLSASMVPDTLGLFYYGWKPANAPFGNGTRCIGGVSVRLLPATVSIAGTASRKVDVLAEGFLPGTTYFQYGFRDPAGGGAGFDLSNGYAITFVP